ncbi:unnamed protein product [Dibothriocephalus latus]|uniref:Uncharacterized protein n=1 Tax=Dibothriocephalus latus TaxID=60516 RepID=A0A3P7Q1V2_DIBLA|nr:unnamed protein product [Dibothriocephalus latus]
MNSPRSDAYHILGALLASALALALLAFVFAVKSCAGSLEKLSGTLLLLNCIPGILVLAAVAYYNARLDNTCRIMAVIGMTFAQAKLLLK